MLGLVARAAAPQPTCMWRASALFAALALLPACAGKPILSTPDAAGAPLRTPESTVMPLSTEVSRTPTLVIAHRGASALRPEHTLAAYAKAIEDGASWIEPDLVSTRDGILVARHENEISGTTDVADRSEFASRKTTKTIDGERVTGWFTEDFTLAELKTLRARERLPQLRSTAEDGRYPVATFDEIIAFAAEESANRGRTIGLVPELKHPSYFAGIGLAMEERLLTALAAHPYTRTAPVMVQSFETTNLRALRARIGRGSHIRLLQLLGRPGERPYDQDIAGRALTYRHMMSAEGLREVATYADAIGPAYRDLDPEIRADGSTYSPLVDAAKAAGLQVIVYTFRPENYFLDSGDRGPGGDAARHDAGSVRQIRRFLALGIDGFFTDDPAIGLQAVQAE
jgi:glycerophosphoryl diester phosphodiesterase